jgi:biopolymer transport protein ExbD
MNCSPTLGSHHPEHRLHLTEAIAKRMIRLAACRSPAALSERLAEEWLAVLPEVDGALPRLRFALGCLWAVAVIQHEPLELSAPVASMPIADIRFGVGGARRSAHWSPKQNSAADALICNLNTTPLIDVMLVLIVTLIVSLPSMTHAVKLELQREAAEQNHIPPEVINLDVDFDGTVVWNGTVAGDLQALEGYYQAEAQKAPLPQINLRPDRRAPYDVVAKVLASAQRNGMTNIQFANTADFR